MKRTAATLLAAAALSVLGAAAPAAADSGPTWVFVVDSTIVQIAQDDVFNAGRDVTVGSHNGTAPAAEPAMAFSSMAATDWENAF
ncbi:hypothetical protein [Streptomyces bambusae]|uniref:Uncharacterized protein n=1 Tax=Streptomyces bambusae TaxID=1550616 RepID=A0ABS6ZC27_9ACTN|nr:hypothetical protein [Streptomyces bambusae]MBW5484205.1 hypothetical protein [Streptomyces bambusae]